MNDPKKSKKNEISLLKLDEVCAMEALKNVLLEKRDILTKIGWGLFDGSS